MWLLVSQCMLIKSYIEEAPLPTNFLKLTLFKLPNVLSTISNEICFGKLAAKCEATTPPRDLP